MYQFLALIINNSKNQIQKIIFGFIIQTNFLKITIMKNLLLFLMLTIWVGTTQAQDNQTEKKVAMSLFQKHQAALGLSNEEMQQWFVSSTYINSQTGIRMVYLNQAYKDIPVFNKMLVLAFKNEALVSNTGELVHSIEHKVNAKDGLPKIVAEQAIITVANELGLTISKTLRLQNQADGKYNFGDLGISSVDISASLVWLPINAKEVRLTWQIEIAPLKSSDHFLFRVDAETNKVIDKNNYTVFENLNFKMFYARIFISAL
jgi:Zn-dependent metalloprotease